MTTIDIKKGRWIRPVITRFFKFATWKRTMKIHNMPHKNTLFFPFYETIYSQTYMLVVVSVAYGIDIWYRLSVLWGKEIISDAKETQHYSSLDAFPWLIA